MTEAALSAFEAYRLPFRFLSDVFLCKNPHMLYNNVGGC